MATLLMQKYQHPVSSGSAAEAGLHAPQNVIAVRDDAWQWGTAELSHDWFRLLQFPGLPVALFQPLLLPLPARHNGDGTPITFSRVRSLYLDITSTMLPDSIIIWWADDTRALPIYVADALTMVRVAVAGVINGLMLNRQEIVIAPQTTGTPAAITS